MYLVSDSVRVLLCVSCVPASCVHIWFVSCPCLISLWVNSCPAVFVSLSVINLCILVHACSVWFRLVYLWLPGVSCLSALSCPALMFIKYYYLSLRPRLHVLVPPSCVHHDRRPDQNSKRRPFTSFCFLFFEKFLFCSCLFVLRHGSRRSLFPP